MYGKYFSIYEDLTPPNFYQYDEDDEEYNDDTMVTDVPETYIANQYSDLRNPFETEQIVEQPAIEIEEPKQPDMTESLVSLARSYVGLPYVSGGYNPSKGFDCSGLLSYVYKQHGIDIGRTTFDIFKAGKEVKLSEVKPGDIICTPGAGFTGKHVKMVSKVDPNGTVYTIEAKGKKWGIVETPLLKTSNIITIRRVIGTQKKNNTSVSTGSNGKFTDKKQFIKALTSTYKEVLKEQGLDPGYAYILTASAAMESGWGRAVSGTFNYGGVKAKTGSVKSTIDWVNGKYIRRNQTFRDFSSIKDYCTYVVNLLQNKRYQAFNAYSAYEPLKFWRHVLDAGYGGGDAAGKNKYMDSIRIIYNLIKKEAHD